MTGLHRTLTSTLSNTFGMNWNADCEPGGLIAQHQCADLTNALVTEWKKVPSVMFQPLVESLPRREEAVIAAMFHHLVESLPRRAASVIAVRGDQLHINAHDIGMRCLRSRNPHTFTHIVYIVYCTIHVGLESLSFQRSLNKTTVTPWWHLSLSVHPREHNNN